jgi:hypothetical protein
LEHDLQIERAQTGHQRAKVDGKDVGRTPNGNEEQKLQIVVLLNACLSVSSTERQFNVSRASIVAHRTEA